VPATNDKRARYVDEAYRLDGGKKPLECEPWTWLRDETSSQGTRRRKPSRAWETPRTEHEVGLGSPVHKWTLQADVAMRGKP
jgi:hypothetical protein